MGIAEFIAARLDEDEAAAKAATPGPWEAETHVDDYEPVGVEHLVSSPAEAHVVAGTGLGGQQAQTDARHIARHDPARVLREVAAKRRILASHGPGSTIDESDGKWRDDPENWDPPEMLCTGHEWVAWPCTEVRAIADVWSGHPDYRAEWKP